MPGTRISMFALAIMAGAAVLGWLRGGNVPLATAAAATTQPAQPIELPKVYFGNAACGGGVGCHGSDTPASERKEKLGDFSTLFARHNEEHVWNAKDRHKIATSVLKEKRGQRIAEAMGIKGDLADPTTNRQWRQCLSCHGVVIEDEKQVDPETFGPKERIASGVSCVACHGPHAEWVNEHYKKLMNRWKTYPREEKQQKFGLRDLWNPIERSRLCCSCHVGNAAEGKVVTHAMYAAGHPPLPSFEIVTYADAMPRHWETMAEKYARLPQVKDIYTKVYHLDTDSHGHQIQLLLASAVVSLRNNAQLFGDYAAKADKPGNARDWPEFALYDCYACHHDLKSDSWRQKRGYVGKAGRPQMTEWPLALVPLAVADEPAKAGEDYHKKLAVLQAAFSKTPFGEPAEVARAASALAASCDAMLKQIEHARFDRDATAKLIAALLQHNKNALPDFDSARQVSWALKVLLDESKPGALKQANVEKPFGRLRDELKLTLPLPPHKESLEEYVPAVMAKRAEYDAATFQENLKALAAALSTK